ncbi:HD-GYP domain-containing protein [Thiorhodospira sibirica]|uniref:HD-GYP domain-containing protein n=1 Tax=Thiorhodospira sibirica TaxID=154347 RepID=UPI00022C5E74|nr:HD-GYP domain-containing protein [Thiorhodospira sibirica]
MLKKISVKHLIMGMYIKEFCASWMEHPFWRTSFLLENPKDLKIIHNSGVQEVWIDTERGLDIKDSRMAISEDENDAIVEKELAKAAHAAHRAKSVPITQELVNARKIIDKSKDAVACMFAEIRMGNAIDVNLAGDIVEHISSSVDRNPGALISLVRLKSLDEYTYMHSVAVCAMMTALAKQLQLSETDIHLAGMAGLLHDLGKVFIPMEILNKPDRLTDDEFYIIKSHPMSGYEVLTLRENEVDEKVLKVCLNHHEKIDGSGYPAGLKNDEINVFAKMCAVCDVYDAITSNRPYKAGWDPAISIHKMASWDGHFNPRIFQAFVKTLGIYPIGSLVSLKSGKLGIVTEQSGQSLLKPIVKVFYSTTSKKAISPYLVDLCTETDDAIRQREDPKDWNLGDLHSVCFDAA